MQGCLCIRALEPLCTRNVLKLSNIFSQQKCSIGRSLLIQKAQMQITNQEDIVNRKILKVLKYVSLSPTKFVK